MKSHTSGTMNIYFKAIPVLLAILSACPVFAQDNFYLKEGDRVVFYGDSITDQRLYTTFTETYVVTRFPERRIDFIHSGWGGDRVSGGGGGPVEVRLNRDVIIYRPTVITVMLGMNDGRYRAFDQEIFNVYSSGYEKLIQMLKTSLPGVRMTLIQPSPYDDVTRAPGFEGGYNAVLVRYGQFVRDLAQKNSLDSADLNEAVVAALMKANALDPESAKKLVPDRVHPGAAGHLLMAAELLKAWHAPALISAVEIDAAAKSVLSASNASVSDLQVGGSLSWTQIDKALPMPLDQKDPVLTLALKSSDFIKSLCQQPLKVTGLAGDGYILKVDGEEVGRFSRQEFAEGINLATLVTPMARQAMAVHNLTLKHNNVHFERWRHLQLPLENESLSQKHVVLGALDALEAEIVLAQRGLAQPKAHRFELIPQ